MIAYLYTILFPSFKVNAPYIRKIINTLHIIMEAILLISFFCLINARVDIISSTCRSSSCEWELLNYVERFILITTSGEDNGMFVSTTSHNIPSYSSVAGLYARAFTTTNGEIEITNFTRTDSSVTFTGSRRVHLHATLRAADVQNIDRCKPIDDDDDDDDYYEKRECLMLIKYYNMMNDQVIKEYAYSLTVGIRKPTDYDFVVSGNPFAGSGNPIIEYGHDYVLNITLKFEIKNYKEDCRSELNLEPLLNYGEDICFGIFGANEITKSFKYEVASLNLTYSRTEQDSETFDVLGITRIRCSLNDICPTGQLYIRVPIMFIGGLRFDTFIVLKDPNRLLKDEDEEELKGVMISLPGVFEIGDLYGRFINDDDNSFGSLVEVGLSTLIALLMILF